MFSSTSSAISHFDINPNLHQLTVQIRNTGQWYEYNNVATEDLQAFQQAHESGGSLGTVYNQVIKPKYQGTEIIPTPQEQIDSAGSSDSSSSGS